MAERLSPWNSLRVRRFPLVSNAVRALLEEGLRIALSISSALAAAHRKGIIHRDIKPGNIMLTPSGAKAARFWISPCHGPFVSRKPNITATLTGEPRTSSALFLTCLLNNYAAKEIDARGDIFSFRAVLYEMLTGKEAHSKAYPAIDTIAAITAMEPTASP